MVMRSILRGTLHVTWMLAAACAVSALVHRAALHRGAQMDVDAWLSFRILALIVFIFLGALLVLWRVVRSSGIRLVLKVVAILMLAYAASCSFIAGRGYVGTFYWPSGQDVDGDFVVKKWSKPDWMDPGDITIQALYFQGREVTRHLSRYVRHPSQPAVVLFIRFESGNLPVTYAFDGVTFRTLRLTSGENMPWDDHQWSPDKTRLVLDWQGDFYLFDIPRWRVSRLTGDGIPPGRVNQVGFGGWSPGSRRFAEIERRSSSLPVVLREWDAETLMVRTVGCRPGAKHQGAWYYDTDFSWQDDSLVLTEEGRRQSVACPDP